MTVTFPVNKYTWLLSLILPTCLAKIQYYRHNMNMNHPKQGEIKTLVCMCVHICSYIAMCVFCVCLCMSACAMHFYISSYSYIQLHGNFIFFEVVRRRAIHPIASPIYDPPLPLVRQHKMTSVSTIAWVFISNSLNFTVNLVPLACEYQLRIE